MRQGRKLSRLVSRARKYLSSNREVPSGPRHNLRYNKVLHEHVVTLMVTTQPALHVPEEQPVAVRPLGQGAISSAEKTLIVTRTPGMAMWREKLVVLMARNAVRATTLFRLPPERVVELGVQVEI